ncbi:aspartyl-phosphate phosphatase Spo0E family protein [Desulforamulus aeronauticus]|nr:aspartyl-phosphate phosphatase Spo0E family protein [Desulforamulus aeronauticus]
MQYTRNSYSQLYLRMIRSRMILDQLVHEFGFNHPKVISYSQKMDQLVTELQKKKTFVPLSKQSTSTC